MLILLYLIGGLGLILISAEVFTNGVEWLGKRMKLSEGTALPESMIPVIAILFGTGEAAHEIGIGAILGAPFMLATLALSLTGFAALYYTVNGKRREPGSTVIILQVLAALGGIIIGAHLFVDGIKHVAEILHISPFVLSIFIAPVATELPEKFNSIIWVRQGKDTLALGNITGARVFQSSLIPALGIALTPWVLSDLAVISAALALAGVGVVYVTLRVKKALPPAALVFVGFIFSTPIVLNLSHLF